MSDDFWDTEERPRKLTVDIWPPWKGAFVVLKYDEIGVPEWAVENVAYYQRHSSEWITPGGAGMKSERVIACRMWLQAGEPKRDGAKPDGSACMKILDLVFAAQCFGCPCCVDDFFVAIMGCGPDDTPEKEWSDLIACRFRDMTDAEKKELGIPVDSSEPPPIATADIIEAVRTEGQATRETVTGGFRGLLEKVGLIRKRATWPRVSLTARKRAAALWRGWSGAALDTGRGLEKVDCFEYYKTELAGYKIESVEHFKAVIDAARK